MDLINETGVGSLGDGEVASVPCPNGYAIVRGWAFDFFAMKPASAVYLQIDGRLVRTNYGESRLDNVALFGHDQGLAPTGFSAAIPLTRLGSGAHEIRIVVVSPDGRKYSTSAKSVRFKTQ